jgi:hypothetical protein
MKFQQLVWCLPTALSFQICRASICPVFAH